MLIIQMENLKSLPEVPERYFVPGYFAFQFNRNGCVRIRMLRFSYHQDMRINLFLFVSIVGKRTKGDNYIF